MALDFSTVMTGQFGQMIVDGTVTTLELALGAWLLAMFIALVLVVIRLTNNRTAQWLISAYVSYHRNVPTLIPVSYTHLTLPTKSDECRSRWSPYH